jgi:hypothetical protein
MITLDLGQSKKVPIIQTSIEPKYQSAKPTNRKQSVKTNA